MITDWFPINLLVIGQDRDENTVPSLYLRWFVKPYLGIVGITPLNKMHSEEVRSKSLGFRLFYNTEYESVPERTLMPLNTVLPKELSYTSTDVLKMKNWKALYHAPKKKIHLQFDLSNYSGTNIRYLQFSYILFMGQELLLDYTIFNKKTHTSTNYQVPLHYNFLLDTLDDGKYEVLTYAIHVDNLTESISTLSLTTQGSLVIGDFMYSDKGFYVWSPAGGDNHWKEITHEKYLLNSLNDPLIQPAEPRKLIDALTEFYSKYYDIKPQHIDSNHVAFNHPDLPQFQVNPPLIREYFADQYDELCHMERKQDNNTFYTTAQELVSLISNDPAIAYLLGLFRVLHLVETQNSKVYKIQGIWPDGKRFCSYRTYEYGLTNPPY